MKNTTSPYIKVKSSDIHNNGVFARTNIPKGTRIIEYVGEKITKAESNRRGFRLVEESKGNQALGAVYLFDLNKRYDIDGNVPYNTARYINHSCDPNCEVHIIRGRIWIVALRDIRKEEELHYNYGYDIEDYEDHKCCCGSYNCVGYILSEDYWPTLRKIINTNNKTVQCST